MSIYHDRSTALTLTPSGIRNVLGALPTPTPDSSCVCLASFYQPNVFHPNGVQSPDDPLIWSCPDCGYQSQSQA